MENNNVISALKMERLVFDKIHFDRKGFMQENSELKMDMNVQIGNVSNSETSIVSLTINGNKENEYSFCVTVSGFFTVDNNTLIEKDVLLKQNAVAILMPYIRSQISLLTAQPGMECVVLPPFNITNIIN